MPDPAHEGSETTAKVPPQLTGRPAERRIEWVLVAGVALTILTLLYLFNPAHHGFYPRCFFHQVTGWQCPGCGGLRAMHQLLHGEVLAALQLNALAVLALPFVAGWIWRARRDGAGLRPRGVWLVVGGLLLYGVARNLPGFDWLSP